jgi:uncharacterized protein (DUF2141 family)
MKHQLSRIAFASAAIISGIGATAPVQAQTAGCQGTPGGGKVRLSVAATDLRNGRGEVVFTIYPDDSARFLAKGGKLLRVRTPARAPVTGACFWVAPGRYAVATYHDENGDHNFNRTLFSIKEGFGFSNDAPTTLGLPKFDRVRFAVPVQGTSIRIRTRYSR